MKEHDPIDMHVGNVLRQARLAAGLSLHQFGSRLGVSYQQIQKYEAGTNRMSASTLYRAATVLGVPLSIFFDGLDGGVPDARSLVCAETIALISSLDRIPDLATRLCLRSLVIALMQTGE